LLSIRTFILASESHKVRQTQIETVRFITPGRAKSFLPGVMNLGSKLLCVIYTLYHPFGGRCGLTHVLIHQLWIEKDIPSISAISISISSSSSFSTPIYNTVTSVPCTSSIISIICPSPRPPRSFTSRFFGEGEKVAQNGQKKT